MIPKLKVNHRIGPSLMASADFLFYLFGLKNFIIFPFFFSSLLFNFLSKSSISFSKKEKNKTATVNTFTNLFNY